MLKTIIAAISTNHVIGTRNGLAWHMPADLAHFHWLIQHKTVLLGRRTFEASEGPPPAGHIIIVTRQSNYRPTISAPAPITVLPSLQAAFRFAEQQAIPEIIILGGGQIYQQTISIADKMEITHIHTTINDGDTFFPTIDNSLWKVVQRRAFKADAENPFDYEFWTYER